MDGGVGGTERGMGHGLILRSAEAAQRPGLCSSYQGLYIVRPCLEHWGSVWPETPADSTADRRLRPVKEMAQSHEYLSIEYSEEEVWLTWTDRNNEHHEKSVRQLAQEARAGNAHDENVLSYYRCPRPLPQSPNAVRGLLLLALILARVHVCACLCVWVYVCRCMHACCVHTYVCMYLYGYVCAMTPG